MWQTKKLKEVAYLAGRIGWKGLTAKEYTDEGPFFLSVHSLNHGDYIDYRRAFHISQERYDESPEIMLEKDDILICKDGAGIGKVGIIGSLPSPTTINSSLLLIRSLDDVYPKYLYYKLISPFFQNIVQEKIDGATTPHLYQREIKEFPIFFPSKDEQKRIVAILELAFADIEKAHANAEQNLKNARELFESYLQQVFSLRSDGWRYTILSDICDVKDGTHDSPKYIEDGIPFVTQKNIRKDGLNFEKTKFISNLDHQHFYKRSNVAIGDILISMIGANRGMSCIVDDKRVFSIKNVGLIKVSEKVDMNFLLHFLKSREAKNYIEVESRGGAQSFIGLTKLRNFPILIAPLDTQKQIAQELDTLSLKLRNLENIYQHKIDSIDELKKSILQKAFTGKLTN